MQIANHWDTGVPQIFTTTQLQNSADYMALFPNKAFEDFTFESIAIPPNPGDSFVTLQAGADTVFIAAGLPEYVGKVRQQVDVNSIRKYPTGEGSDLDFRQILQVLRAALCGHCGVDVSYEGAVIGTVDTSSFSHTIGLRRIADGNFDVLQKGISVLITYR